MKSHVMTIAAAVAAIATMPGCGRSSPPQRRAASTVTPEDVARAAHFRISGAALMMTPEEVASTLRGAGYALSERGLDTQLTDSFEDMVQERLTGGAVPHPRQVPGHQTWTKGREKIEVRYGLYPGSSRVTSINWSTEDPSPTDAEIAGKTLRSWLAPAAVTAGEVVQPHAVRADVRDAELGPPWHRALGTGVDD